MITLISSKKLGVCNNMRYTVRGELSTQESGIDVGQGITVGPGKFVKKNKRRALNKRRA